VNLTENDRDANVLVINSLQRDNKSKIVISPTLDGKPVTMELDTGSAVTLISNRKFKSLFGNVPLSAPDSTLKTYSGEIIEQVGSRVVTVSYNSQTKKLPIIVVKKDGPSLFGRDWLQHIKVDWNSIFNVNSV
jgi:hypothetical protein